MNSMWKRSFALLLSLVMVFGMVPVNAFAEETEAEHSHSYVDGICSGCGDVEHTHSYEATVTAPTCTDAGYTTYTCGCGHSYTADEVAAAGHTYVEGVCACGAEEHTHSYESVVTAPTCTEAGYTTYTCSCGDSYTADEVAAAGHTYVEGICACGAEEPAKEEPVVCDGTEGCELVKNHPGECTGAAVYEDTSIQGQLDNAVPGTTITLPAGHHGVLYIRPSANAGVTKVIDWVGNNYVYETLTVLENVTIRGEEGAVVDAIVIEGDTYYNSDHSQMDQYPVMLSLVELKNVVIEGITFTGNGGKDPQGYGNAINLAGQNIQVNGLTIRNCVLDNSANNARLLYKTEGTTYVHNYTYGGTAYTFVPTLSNITVTGCTFNGGYMGLELREATNVTITDNTFNNLASRNILLPANTGCNYAGTITISGNTSNGSAERFIRATSMSNANLVVENNKVVNYQGPDDDFIKIDNMPSSYSIKNNTFEGIVVNPELSGGTVKLFSKTADDVVAKIGDVSYVSLTDAIAAGGEITLLKDVTLNEAVKVEKPITLDLNGKTVTGTAKDIFRFEADATIKNGTLANTASAIGRCVNTRAAVTLNLENVNMSAIGSGNNQPVTVGGTTDGAVINISGCTIDAGESGYCVWVAVESDITITDSTLVGYGNIYTAQGSDYDASGSVVAVSNSSLTANNNVSAAESNSFSAICVEAPSTVRVTGGSITVNGNTNKQFIIGGGTNCETVSGAVVEISESTSLTLAGAAGTQYINIHADLNTVKIPGADLEKLAEKDLKLMNGQIVKRITTEERLKTALSKYDTVTLDADITLTAPLAIEKTVTLDLNGKTVTGSAKKVFEIYADTTIKNGKIINTNNEGRCVDTRTAVKLTLEKVELTAAGNGNTQPLTIGGADHGVVLSVKDCSINAGKTGYSIISFVKTNATIENSKLNGYGNIHLKAGSDGSEFTVTGNSALSASKVSPDETFGAIIFDGTEGCTVTMDANTRITALNNAILFSAYSGSVAGKNTVHLNGAVEAENVIMNFVLGDSTVTVPASNTTLINQLKTEGYVVKNGKVTLPVEEEGSNTTTEIKNPTLEEQKVIDSVTKNEAVAQPAEGLQEAVTEQHQQVDQIVADLLEETETLENVVSKEVKTTVSVTLKDVDTVENSQEIKSMTFDVEPQVQLKVTQKTTEGETVSVFTKELELQSAVKFRLPIYGTTEGELVAVDHEGKPMGTYVVQKEGNDLFIEIVSADFSPWTVKILPKDFKPVAAIGTVKYATVKDALTAAKSGNTIKLLQDAKAFYDEYTFNSTITLDLNGNNMYCKSLSVQSGTLTIKDSLKDSTAELTCSVIVDGGSLKMESGIINYDEKCLDLKSGAVSLTGGIITARIANNVAVTVSGGTLEINGSQIGGQALGIQQTGGQVTVTNGLVSGQTGICVSGGKLTVTGGNIVGFGEKKAFVNEGDLTGDALMVVNTGSNIPKVSVTGGSFSSTNGMPIGSYSKVTTPVGGFLEGGTHEGITVDKNILHENFEYAKKTENVYEVKEKSYIMVDGEKEHYAAGTESMEFNSPASVGSDKHNTIITLIDGGKVTLGANGSKTFAPKYLDNKGWAHVTATFPDANGKLHIIHYFLDKGATLTVAANGTITTSGKVIVGDNGKGNPAYNYTITQNNIHGNVHVRNSSPDMVITCNGFLGACKRVYITGGKYGSAIMDVYNNGSAQNGFSVVDGSTKVTLTKGYLNGLTDGTYTMVFQYKDGEQKGASFKVTTLYTAQADTTNPKTGDVVFAPMFALFFSTAALAVLLMGKKKFF